MTDPKRRSSHRPIGRTDRPAPIVCPQCKAQYLPQRPVSGRRVRCRHCKYVWRHHDDATEHVAGALGAAASAWSQMGSTLMAAADHGSTMGRIARRLTQAPKIVPGEWIGRTLGRYEIRSVLGLGAMGHVYEAFDRDLERPVALKVLPRRIDPLHQPLGLRLFLQEARVAARIQHPNVVTIHEIGSQDGVYFFAMERVSGITLSSLVEQSGPLPAYQACYLISHAAKGLAAGHALGIVHRDVKPGNIMIDGYGRVKITDFGLADVSGITAIEELSKRTLGTPGWISPEVARSERPTPASDIYSLGLTLFFALTKERLVTAETKSGMVRRQAAAGNVPRERLPANWPPRLCDALLQCLRAEPAERYQSADQLSADLMRAIVHDEKDGTLNLGDRHSAAVSLRPATTIIGRAALAALFLVAASLFVWWWFLR